MTLKSNRASVLAGITGSFPCGSLVALMGPSGGGKTTFMNALLGRAAYGNVTGDITVNGVKGGLTSVPSLVGFVPQVMIPPLPPSPVGGAAPPPLLLTVACRPPSRRLRAAGRHRPPKPDRLREPLLPRDDAAAAQDLQGGQGAPRSTSCTRHAQGRARSCLLPPHNGVPPSPLLPRQVRHVVHTLKVLRIDHIRDSLVGDASRRGVSGGQKKRVNIGMELVAMPAVCFMDEPTSGLDGAATSQLAQCLGQLRKSGLTIICVIHQPRYSVYKEFTHLLLLGAGGRQVYCGDTSPFSRTACHPLLPPAC